MNNAQRELCEKLDAPLHTADDCMVMAEASNEIRYLAARVDALERDAARRTTPDREAWQPIETAPKDGTPILGCTFHPNLRHLYAPCAIVWAAYHPNSEGEKTWRTSAVCGNKMKGVTHWMPLPIAPNGEKG